jgi:hypothetical protein
MIRRLLWLTIGAVLGVAGYRRLAALGRSLPPVLRVRELTRFASDVREGMALYAQRHPHPGAPGHRELAGRELAGHGHANGHLPGPDSSTDDVKDGR